VGQIPAPVLLFQFQCTQALEVLLQSLADQSRSIHLVPLGRKIGRFQELGIQHDLYNFHCGFSSTV
jgi:hypothetical protein